MKETRRPRLIVTPPPAARPTRFWTAEPWHQWKAENRIAELPPHRPSRAPGPAPILGPLTTTDELTTSED